MIMTVFGDVVSPEREAEWNDWYDNVHLADVCAVPGVLSARRFVRSETRSVLDAPVAGGQRYLAVYEIETDDPDAVEREMGERGADGRLRPTDAWASDPGPVVVYYREI
jgi:hypothetical protein